MIVKRGDKYVVTTKDGRVLGTHASRRLALRQLAAVESAKQSREMKYKRGK